MNRWLALGETIILPFVSTLAMSMLYGAIEAGGTKFVCAVGSGPSDLEHTVRFDTLTPDETLRRTIDFFQRQNSLHPLAAIGIGSFGPLDLHRGSSTYGYITSTPKPGWAQTDFVGTIQRSLRLPVGFDTDVNAAALGEHRWGAAQGLHTFVYLTIGTGIGGGAMVNGSVLHGLVHTEMGHIRIPHDRGDDPYAGKCPFHGDCFEGLASGPAIQDRWGTSAESLEPGHPAWHLEARYIALALVNMICTLSPQRIVLGGGVMEQRQLFPMIRQNVETYLAGYVQAPEILHHSERYIVSPALGDRAGILGAIALAADAAGGHS